MAKRSAAVYVFARITERIKEHFPQVDMVSSNLRSPRLTAWNADSCIVADVIGRDWLDAESKLASALSSRFSQAVR